MSEVFRVLSVVDINTFFGLDRHRDVDWSLDTLRRLLDEHRVFRALTYSLRGVHFDFVLGNRETAAAAARDERLVPVVTFDPRRYLDCVEEARRCLGEGLRVFRVFPDVQGWTLSDLHFLRVMEILAEGQGALMVRAAAPGQPSLAARVLGSLGIPVVLLGVGYSTFGELLAALLTSEHLYCDSHMFNTPGACETVCREAGADRLMLGTGLPERYFSSAYLMVERAELTEDERGAILGGNAARVLLGQEV